MKEIEYKFLLNTNEKLENFRNIISNVYKTKERWEQLNWYYIAPWKNDLRIRKTETESYLILKVWDMHDESKEEYEVKCDREEFEKLDKMLSKLGYSYDTKWFRYREEFEFNGFNITLDENSGFWWMAEIEKVVEEWEEEQAKKEILEFAQSLGLDPTPKSDLDLIYNHYKKNWKEYYDERKVINLESLK